MQELRRREGAERNEEARASVRERGMVKMKKERLRKEGMEEKRKEAVEGKKDAGDEKMKGCCKRRSRENQWERKE